MNKVYRNDGVIGNKGVVCGYYKKGKVYDDKKNIIGYYENGCIYNKLEQGGKGSIVGYYENGIIYNKKKEFVVAHFHNGEVRKKKILVGEYDGNEDGGAAASYLLLLNGLHYKNKYIEDHDVAVFLVILIMIPLCILLHIASEKFIYLHPEFMETITRNMSIAAFGAIVVFIFLCMSDLKEIKVKQIVFKGIGSFSVGYMISYIMFAIDFIFFHDQDLNIFTIFIGLLVLLVMNCFFMSKTIFFLMSGVIIAYFWSNFFNSKVEKKAMYIVALIVIITWNVLLLKTYGAQLIERSFFYLMRYKETFEITTIIHIIQRLDTWGFFSVSLAGTILMLGYKLQIHHVIHATNIINMVVISNLCYVIYIGIMYVSSLLAYISWAVTFVLIALVIMIIYKKVEEMREE